MMRVKSLNESQNSELLVEIAKNLISFPTEISYRIKQAPGAECAEHARDLLQEHGFNVKIIIKRNESIDRNIYSVLAWKGNLVPRILFLGHLDVVPADPNAWQHDPYNPRVEGDRLYGRGAADMKGPVASMITAFHDYDPDDLGTLMFLFSGDEEEGGFYSVPPVIEYLEQHDMMPTYVINGEPSNHELVTKRRGLAQFQVTLPNEKGSARGAKRTATFNTIKVGDESLHTARFTPGADVHALIAASKALFGKKIIHVKGDFLKENRVPREITVEYIEEKKVSDNLSARNYNEFSLGLTTAFKALAGITGISFPTKPSIVGRSIAPNVLEVNNDHVKISFDIRTMTNDTNAIKQALETHFSQFTNNFEIRLLRASKMMNVDPEHPLPKALVKAATETGITVTHVGEKIGGGSSDSRFFTSLGIPAAEIGPVHERAHSPDEWVSISSLAKLAIVYRRSFELITESLTQDPW